MLERKENVHFCCKCGKGMAYEEKQMVYLYKVETSAIPYYVKGSEKQWFKKRPKVQRAYNLCGKCAQGFSELLDIFLNMEE